MANEKLACNQMCRWNNPSDGCVKPTHATCPLSNSEPDASGWGQVQEDKKRLIDANALMLRVDESKRYNPHHDGKLIANHRNEHDHFFKLIYTAPTVDAVEVVRCKDCKFAKPLLLSKIECSVSDLVVEMDGYCSCGERKDNA